MQTRLNEEYYSRIEKKRRFFLKSRAKSRLTCGGFPRWLDRTLNGAERVGFRLFSERRGVGFVAINTIEDIIETFDGTATEKTSKNDARREVERPPRRNLRFDAAFRKRENKENERRKREKVAARRRTTKIFLRSDPTTRF